MGGGIHTYLTVVGMISISDDGEGRINGLYLPSSNLPAMEDRETEVLSEAISQIEEYFSGKRKDFDLPLAMEGTDFQKAVWNAIRDIPYGETRTYRQVAEAIGRPGAYRAVGTACHLNPVPIIVPCHRVTSASGPGLGYAGGSILKKRLLDLESRK